MSQELGSGREVDGKRQNLEFHFDVQTEITVTISLHLVYNELNIFCCLYNKGKESLINSKNDYLAEAIILATPTKTERKSISLEFNNKNKE